MTVSTIRLVSTLALLALGSAAYAGGPGDTDGDGVLDAFDNCINVFNPAQRDTDGDGFGNFCDPDFNNDGIVNFPDLGLFKAGVFGTDPDLDLDGDGMVTFADLQIVKNFFFGPPGPSAPNTPPTGLAIDNNSVDENQPAGTAVGTFSTTDPNPGNTHTYTLVAGAGDTDNAQFTIVGDVLQTAAVLNHEAADNCVTSADTCSIRVQTEDNLGGTFQQSFIINIGDVNDAPEITSDGGGDNATVNAAENQSAVTTVTATDEDLPAQNLTFSITGGADAGAFSIGTASGVLTFSSAPNFEAPADAGGDNVYDVQVTVTDDGAPTLSDVQDIAVTVTDVNDAPVITSDGGGDNASVNAPEEQTAVTTVTATDEDLPAQNLTFTISGGADAGAFSIGAASGVLTFSSAPDFENPTDSGGDNVYDVQVTVTDDGAPNLSDVQDIAVTVTNVNENSPPVITSDGGGDNATVNAAENQTAVTTVTATDPEAPPQVLTFSISGGADGAAFSINSSSGVLTFNVAPNFELPQDTGGDNVYDVQVTVTDDGAPTASDSQDIAVTVTDANDDPTDIALDNSSVDENEPVGTAVGTFTTTDEDAADTHTYTLVAGPGDTDNAQFAIVGDQLQTAAVLNHEAATNCTTSASNCSIRVQSDDGSSGTFQEPFIITINNVNDAPSATDDPYSGAVGNTDFALVTALSGTTPYPPTVELVGDIDANDTDEDSGDLLSVTANASIATTQGGTAAVDANGQFTYSPPAGFPGSGANADSFTYEVCDNGAPVLCDNGTVTISGSDIVWYVDDSSPNNPGTGTASDPFRDLSSASGAPTAAGEIIFVFAGTHTTGISLLNNQSLLGEGVALVVGPTTLVNAGTRPVITTTGTAITLAQSNTVRGIDITNSNTGIVGNTFGTLTGDSIAINTTGGPGIDLTSGAGSITFDSLSSSVSSGAGIDLDSVSGTFSFGSGSISGSTGNGIDITGSTASISYGGTVTAGSGLAVNVTGHSANGVDLSGLILSTGQGILLNNNTGGTITFRGGMDLDTGAGSAFSATNGGTVNVCADTNCEAAGGTLVSNLVATTTATAVAINTTIGAGGVTFDDVEVTGPTSHGIDIANAGSGGFTVNGGMINNTTGNGIRIDNTNNIAISGVSLTDAADDNGAGCSTVAFNCNAVIEFNSVSTVDLTNVTILRSDEHGIFGTNVTDLDLTNVSITDAGNGTDSSEHGIFIRNLLGTVAAGTDSRFDNVDIDDSASNGIFVENTLGTTASAAQPDLLTVTGTSSTSNHGQNSGIIVETDAAAANLKLDVQSGYQSTNNSTRGISLNANAGRLQADVDGATFGGGGHFKAIGGGSAAAGANSELIVSLTNNNITQSGAAGTGPGGISFSSFSTGAFDGTMRGTIQGNFITSAGNTLSGITLTNEGDGTANRFLIDDNEIQLPAAGSSGLEGMRLVSRIGTGGRLDLIITNNIVNIPNNTDDFTGGIVTIAGNSGGTGTNTLCVKMANNDVDTPAKDAMWGSQHEYALIAWTGNTMIIDSLVAEGLPVTDAGMGTYVSPGAPNNPGAMDGVNIAGMTSIGINSAVQLLGATLLDGTCTAP